MTRSVLAWILAGVGVVIAIVLSIHTAQALQSRADRIHRDHQLLIELQGTASTDTSNAAYSLFKSTPASGGPQLETLLTQHALVVTDRQRKNRPVVAGYKPVETRLRLAPHHVPALLTFLGDAAAARPPWTLTHASLQAAPGHPTQVTADLTFVQLISP